MECDYLSSSSTLDRRLSICYDRTSKKPSSSANLSRFTFITKALSAIFVLLAFVVESVSARADVTLSTFAPNPGSSAGYRIYGPSGGVSFGTAIASAGDVNSDGLPDILIGAPDADITAQNTGSTFLLFGRSYNATYANINTASFVSSAATGVRVVGAATEHKSGSSVRSAGDVNGDNIDDFIIGAPFATVSSMVEAGMAFIVLGKNTGTFSPLSLSGSSDYSITTISGGFAGGHVGWSVSGVGDFNGDGFDDVLVGAPGLTVGGTLNVGVSYLLFGRATMPTAFPRLDTFTSSSSEGMKIIGEGSNSAGDFCGTAVSGAGDVNDDGFADVMIGADGTARNGIPNVGAVYILFGRDAGGYFGDILLGHPFGGITIYGPEVGAGSFGFSVSALGDISGDGVDDVIVGAPYADANSGCAYVFYGSSAFVLHTTIDVSQDSYSGYVIIGENGQMLGMSVAGVGDVNGDGVRDLAVGATGASYSGAYAGVVLVLYGRGSSWSTSGVAMGGFTSGAHGFRILGPSAGAMVGTSVAPAGDLNGDGVADLLVSAPNAATNGIVYAVFGQQDPLDLTFADMDKAWQELGSRVFGSGTGDRAGTAVSTAGDVDGDGVLDMIVGAPRHDHSGRTDCGAVYVVVSVPEPNAFSNADVYGSLDLANIMNAPCSRGFMVFGASGNDRIGVSVDLIGDFNGDGRNDIVIGAPNAVSVYGAYVIYSPQLDGVSCYAIDLNGLVTSGVGQQGFKIIGPNGNAGAGSVVANAGDVNHDGTDDLLITAPHMGISMRTPGSVFVVFSKASHSFTDFMLDTVTAASGLGFRITGNVDGDLLGMSAKGNRDFNGDGRPDLLLGAPGAASAGRVGSGKVYVVFTNYTAPVADIDFMTDSKATRIYAQAAGDQLGYAVTLMDVNGDGLADAVMSAYNKTEGSRASAGVTYVVYGRAASGNIDLASPAAFTSGVNGFRIYGGQGYKAGSMVASVGDINRDGLKDMAVSAPGAGKFFVLYAQRRSTVRTDVDLSAFVSGMAGFTISSSGVDITSAAITGLGDVTGDGVNDLAVSAPAQTYFSRTGAGTVYLIHGRIEYSATLMPTRRPSSAPTTEPSVSPSAAPTAVPSAAPTDAPTPSPTLNPTLYPTEQPTYAPTAIVHGNERDQDFDSAAAAHGMRLFGGAQSVNLGQTVGAAGDFNGDTVQDFAVSVPSASFLNRYHCGVVYLVYGKAGTASYGENVNVSEWTSSGARGFRVIGAYQELYIGSSIVGGTDLNRDGYDDVLLSATNASPLGRSYAGLVYVLFGGPFSGDLDLAAFTAGINGFVIYGPQANTYLSSSMTFLRDFNGDNCADLAVSTTSFRVNNTSTGRVYILFGRCNDYYYDIDLADFPVGRYRSALVLSSERVYETFGYTVADVGDVNADGFSDLLVGALSMWSTAVARTGGAYVFLGHNGTVFNETAIDIHRTPAGRWGFRVYGEGFFDRIGYSASAAGDFNGDGIDDFAVGSRWRRAPNRMNCGGAYVLFGKRGHIDDIRLNSTSLPGVRIVGARAGDFAGHAITRAGDLNQDGLSDVFVSAPGFDPPGTLNAGAVYVLHGSRTPKHVDLRYLNDSSVGYAIRGTSSPETCGYSVAAGDFNSDGYRDVLVGCISWNSNSGEAFVVYGNAAPTRSPSRAPTAQPSARPTLSPVLQGQVVADYGNGGETYITSPDQGVRLVGAAAGDETGQYVTSLGDYNGDGVDDVSVFAVGVGLPSQFDSGGVVYVLFGVSGFAMTDFDLANFASGSSGFRIVNEGSSIAPLSGPAVALGDVNGDGRPDLGVAAITVSTVYVIFGPPATSQPVDVFLDMFDSGISGYRIYGTAGMQIFAAGDVNGDGIQDMLLSSDAASPAGRLFAGMACLRYGRRGAAQDVDLSSMAAGINGYCIYGAVAGDHTGIAVSSAGDFNGDGYGDIAIGSYFASYAGRPGAGTVHVVLGNNDITNNVDIDLAGWVSSDVQGFVIGGAASSDRAGSSVASLGDVNGDGRPDLAVGVPRYDANAVSNSGMVAVLFGTAVGHPASDLDLASFQTGNAGFRIFGAESLDYAGRVVAPAGDVNGDGHTDILVSYVTDVSKGAFVVIYGRSRAVPFTDIDLHAFVAGPVGFKITSGTNSDSFASSVMGGVDLNDDGLDDIIAGSFGTSLLGRPICGAAYVFYGRRLFPAIEPPTATPTAAPSYGPMDVNIAGWTTPRWGYRIFGANAGDNVGQIGVKMIPDFNGDGLGELVVPAPGATYSGRTTCGIVYVLYGPKDRVIADVDLLGFAASATRGFRLFGAFAADRLGIGVDSAGDINGDGKSDLLISALNQNFDTRNKTGAVYVLFARNITSDIDLLQAVDGPTGFRIVGAHQNGYFGRAVTGLGDLDGDGLADFAISATGAANAQGADRAGITYVFFGKSGATFRLVDLTSPANSPLPVLQVVGAAADDQVGLAVCAVGDLSGDGLTDFAVSAPFADSLATDGGTIFVIFSTATMSQLGTIDLAALTVGGSQGFRIDGATASGAIGFSLALIPDMNGDGRKDLAIGSINSESTTGSLYAGAVVVLFIPSPAQIGNLRVESMVAGGKGFIVHGASAYGRLGYSISSVRDSNGDGVNELMVTALYAGPQRTGIVYSLRGRGAGDPWRDIDLNGTLPGDVGTRLIGTTANGGFGSALTQGIDINGDGNTDIAIGAAFESPFGREKAGTVYVMAGTPQPTPSPSAAPSAQPTIRPTAAPTAAPSISAYDVDTQGISSQEGFLAAGARAEEYAGNVEGLGDVNGDGFDDFAVSAYAALALGRYRAGTVSVVYGHPASLGFPDLDLLTFGAGSPTTGYTIAGPDNSSYLGIGVKRLGDVNGDGLADFAFSASGELPHGAIYVKFGSMDHPGAIIDTAAYVTSADTGYKVLGSADYVLGANPSNGADLNGDELNDFVVSCPSAASGNAARAGVAFVIFGRSAQDGIDNVHLGAFVLGTNGFRIHGIADLQLGLRTALVGDFNGDGRGDIALTANRVVGDQYQSQVHIVYTPDPRDGIMDLPLDSLDYGSQALLLTTPAATIAPVPRVNAVGDVNGDGFADVIFTSHRKTVAGKAEAGVTYIVFGAAGLRAPSTDMDNMPVGFGLRLLGAEAYNWLGVSVNGAGDVDGDGRPDLLISARNTSLPGRVSSGTAYVIYGGSHLSNLTELDMATFQSGMASGYRIYGANANDFLGSSVASAGDVNGDGRVDVLVGSFAMSPYGRGLAGGAYLLFGQQSRQASKRPSAAPTVVPTLVPTLVPSAAPTSVPTVSPTAAPSDAPTIDPTLSPSASPTLAPTTVPSAFPTLTPSASPTAAPTTAPTSDPTEAPTVRPSAAPTVAPTAGPTTVPTASPSADPSVAPSSDPTVVPTVSPSAAPTAGPTLAPSAGPTMVPTADPSIDPTVAPTVDPTVVPTASPSIEPTVVPTCSPSASPSVAPTTTPSELPSVEPTVIPSVAPSVVPTAAPSSAPSAAPTAVPSAEPSMLPSTQPTVAPSAQPSTAPTTAPSQLPSASPSVAPSADPSAVPTESPSLAPSALPSLAPTAAPTMLPTAVSSAVPTVELTARPSSLPTVAESDAPTAAPTSVQTDAVTAPPSLDPTANPSEVQTAEPTQEPSSGPLADPSADPSALPTVTPTLVPTFEPTARPSAAPSVHPSPAPSAAPSTQPTKVNEPAVPALAGAVFTTDGTAVLLTFNAATDRAGLSSATFQCNSLLEFMGATKASCQWMDATTMAVFTNVLRVSSPITLLSGKVRAQCSSTTAACAVWATVPATTLQVGAPAITVAPVVAVKVQASASQCLPLSVDFSSSRGSAGRPWASYEVQVGTIPADASAAALVQETLTQNFTTAVPVVVPSARLQAGLTYQVQLTLCNFLGACGVDIGTVAVESSELLLPVVAIQGSATRAMFRRSLLSLTSDAYTQTCKGDISRAGLQLLWQITSLTDGVTVPAGTKSTSVTPTVFQLDPYSIAAGADYAVTLTALAVSSGRSGSARVVVTVQRDGLTARVSGGTVLNLKVGSVGLVDASKSVDGDVQGLTGVRAGLVYSWTCVQSLPSLGSCPLSFISTPVSEKLNVTAPAEAVNTTSLLTVTVSDASGTRSNSAVITVRVTGSVSPVLSITSALPSLTNINADKTLALLGTVTAYAPCEAAWTLQDSAVSVRQVSATPLTMAIPGGARAQPFNLVIPGKSLPQRATLVFHLSCGGADNAIQVTTNSAPLPGSFTVRPDSGQELSTPFLFSATEWSDPDLPLLYRFIFAAGGSQGVVADSELSFASSTLPAGDESDAHSVVCSVLVSDSIGAGSPASASVTVTPIVSAEAQQSALQALVQSDSGSAESTKGVINIAAAVMNRGECADVDTACLDFRRDLRANLVGSLNSVTQQENANERTLQSWSSSLASLAQNPSELTADAAASALAVANSTVHGAKAVKLDSVDGIVGLLSATDTVLFLTSDNDTAVTGVREVVSAFAELLGGTLYAGQNKTNLVYSNFQLSSEVRALAADANASVSSPQSADDVALGLDPITAKLVPSQRSTTVAVNLVSLPVTTYGTTDANFTSKPLQLQVAATDGQSAVDALREIELTFPFSESQPQYVNYQPANFTSQCKHYHSVHTYQCPDSGALVVHNCSHGLGVYNSICPKPAPVCAKFGSELNGDATLTVPDSCRVVSYDALSVTCACRLQPRSGGRRLETGEQDVLDKTGTTTLISTGTFIALEFADTFNAAGRFNDPAAVIVVIIMFATLWGAGLTLLSTCFVRNYMSMQKKLKQMSKQVIAAASGVEAGNSMDEAKERLLTYIDNVIPSVYSGEKSRICRLLAELRSHHRYLTLFTLGDGQMGTFNKILIISQVLTMETMQMFLLAVLYDLQGPDDDGTCTQYMDESSCLNRKSMFDSTQSYCKWQYDEPKDRMVCSYQDPSFSITVFIYILILTSIFTAIINTPLDYLFKVCAAPLIEDAMEAQLANAEEKQRFAVASGLRRLSVQAGNAVRAVGRRGSALVANTQQFVKKQEWYQTLLMTSKEKAADSVIADREISEDLQQRHKEAVAGLAGLIKHTDTMLAKRERMTLRLKQRAESKRNLTQAATKQEDSDAEQMFSADELPEDTVHKPSEPRPSALTASDSAAAPSLPRYQSSSTIGVTRGSGKTLLNSSQQRSLLKLQDDVLCQRLLLPADTPQLQIYDAQWGVVPSSATGDVHCISEEALQSIGEDMAQAEEDAKELGERMPHYTLQHGGLAILNLFLLDLLGRRTIAAKIFKNKFEEDFEETKAVSQAFKGLAILLLLAFNAFFIYYTLLKALQKGKTWQYQFLRGCVAQLIVEVFLNETLECIWLNYVVPDLARKEVQRVHAVLSKVVDQITDKATRARSLLFLDAPAFLFSSTKVARQHPKLLESIVVLNFHTHLPGELARSWPHYQKSEVFLNSEEMKVVPDADLVGPTGTKLTNSYLFRAILAVGTSIVLTMQWLGTFPFNIQRIFIRFVQPMLLSGLTLLWLFASSSMVALTVVLCVFGAVILAFLWRQRYLYLLELRNAKRILPLQDDSCLEDKEAGEESEEEEEVEEVHDPHAKPDKHRRRLDSQQSDDSRSGSEDGDDTAGSLHEPVKAREKKAQKDKRLNKQIKRNRNRSRARTSSSGFGGDIMAVSSSDDSHHNGGASGKSSNKRPFRLPPLVDASRARANSALSDNSSQSSKSQRSGNRVPVPPPAPAAVPTSTRNRFRSWDSHDLDDDDSVVYTLSPATPAAVKHIRKRLASADRTPREPDLRSRGESVESMGEISDTSSDDSIDLSDQEERAGDTFNASLPAGQRSVDGDAGSIRGSATGSVTGGAMPHSPVPSADNLLDSGVRLPDTEALLGLRNRTTSFESSTNRPRQRRFESFDAPSPYMSEDEDYF